jgi:diguanylate cyclase (GGDEF)-like protein
METCTAQPVVAEAATLEQKIRAKIESLSYLPTSAAVAMKFIELGKDPDAEPADYAKVIGADGSLSSKLLAMANSPWFGVRNRVTSVRMAVNLLGLGTVRTLAISYCMAGLHNGLRLNPEESRMFWETSLCRAAAAKQCAMLLDPTKADEAFMCGIFQDFALPVMYAVAKKPVAAILRDPKLTCQQQLDKERTLCRLDHAEIGRILAQKMELPEMFVDAVAFHHRFDRLDDFIESDALGRAVYVSSLFPATMDAWNHDDAAELCRFMEEHCRLKPEQLGDFLWKVQEEFNRIFHFFENGEASETRLAELMVQAAEEEADKTTCLVRTVQELMQDAAKMGVQINQLVQARDTLEDKAERDPLTGLLNREGLNRRAADLLANVARYRLGFAVAFFDIDRFKSVNDRYGHDFGDRALRQVATRIAEVSRQQDIAARIGGDEFVLMMYDCREADALQVVRRIVEHVAATPVGKSKKAVSVTVSGGLLYVQPSEQKPILDTLFTMADQRMYQAKRNGGNQVYSE